MTELHPRIRSEFLQLQRTLSVDGTLPSAAQLQVYYDAFRREFGPEVLRSLAGEELLERIHDHGNRDSLVYWLEFKDDETFPALFGSIAGGSALKFGIYRRAETGAWATKGPGSAPRDIPLNTAIEIARRHRDQLLAAADILATMPAGTDDARYLALQRELISVAPDVQDTVWGHKYLSLLYPDVLDGFHVYEYQRYNVIRILQPPPRDNDAEAQGRYVCAGRFVGVARELDVSLHDATALLNRRHGPPRSYWRIGTTNNDGPRRNFWPMMRDNNLVAVGWPAVGDLSSCTHSRESKESVAARLQQHYPSTPQAIGRTAGQLLKFATRITEGDRVIASDGQTVLGIGEVAGPYSYDASSPFPHQRPVIWRSLVEWKAVDAEGLRTSVCKIKDARNQIEIERRILDDADSIGGAPHSAAPTSSEKGTGSHTTRGLLPRLSGMAGRVQAVLERKGQVILYGPPGTGKTYWALRSARDLAALRASGIPYDQLRSSESHRARIDGAAGAPGLVRLTSFHPEYGYEDFIEGYRPRTDHNGSLSFALVTGVFRRLCADAVAEPDLDFYLVIDEINRGDIPRIFGELLTLLERDKRSETVILPASGEPFRVPPNVYVLGTMNTADRSIALLDVALRRRFGFVELMPDYSLLQGISVGGLPLGAWLKDLNARIRRTGGGDARNRQIGHAFLLQSSGAPLTTVEQLAAVLRDDIVPLLEEYSYDDFEQLTSILGTGLVDLSGQRVKSELFEAGRGEDLVAALLRPEIAVAADAIMTESKVGETQHDDDSESDEVEVAEEAALPREPIAELDAASS